MAGIAVGTEVKLRENDAIRGRVVRKEGSDVVIIDRAGRRYGFNEKRLIVAKTRDGEPEPPQTDEEPATEPQTDEADDTNKEEEVEDAEEEEEA